MRISLFISSLFILLTFLAGSCKKSNPTPPTPTPDAPASQTTKNIVVDGLNREYIIYLPSGYNNAASMPLIFLCHGGGGNDSGMVALTSFNAIAEREKAIAIYPNSTGTNWNDGRPTPANLAGTNDVNYIRTLINTVIASYSINQKRIFITGISNGGFFSSKVACEMSDKIAAFASVAASIEKNTVFATCSPANPVSAMYLQGTLDPLVPFLGGTMTSGAGGVIASHSEAITKWMTINNSGATPTITNMPDNSPTDGTTTTRRDFVNNTNTTMVSSLIVTGGGHTWPGGLQYQLELIIGKTSRDFSANEVIWEFFKTHPKP